MPRSYWRMRVAGAILLRQDHPVRSAFGDSVNKVHGTTHTHTMGRGTAGGTWGEGGRRLLQR